MNWKFIDKFSSIDLFYLGILLFAFDITVISMIANLQPRVLWYTYAILLVILAQIIDFKCNEELF